MFSVSSPSTALNLHLCYNFYVCTWTQLRIEYKWGENLRLICFLWRWGGPILVFQIILFTVNIIKLFNWHWTFHAVIHYFNCFALPATEELLSHLVCLHLGLCLLAGWFLYNPWRFLVISQFLWSDVTIYMLPFQWTYSNLLYSIMCNSSQFHNY